MDENASSTTDVVRRLTQAINQHDLDALADCFHLNYDSTFPVHPARAFKGQEQMRNNWASIFASVPDIRSVLVRSATAGNIEWTEWEWSGTRADGRPLDMRGVTIQEIHMGKIAWVRMYMEPIEPSGINVDAAVRCAVGAQSTLE